MGSELKPHKSTKRSEKPNLVAPGTKNVGFSGYSRPFSDSFRLVFSETRGVKREPRFLPRLSLLSTIEVDLEVALPLLMASFRCP